MAGNERLLSALADARSPLPPIAVSPDGCMPSSTRRLRHSGQRAWPTPAILPYAGWLAALWETILAHETAAEPRTLLSAAQAIALWQRRHRRLGATLADVRGAAAALASDAWSHVHRVGRRRRKLA